MNVLITGATGLVGTALIKELKKSNNTIHYLTTSPSKLNSIEGCKGFLWNPGKNEIDSNCWEGISVLIHLAGASISMPWTVKNRELIRNSRTQSAALLTDSLKENQKSLKTVVAASAIGVYPSSLSEEYKEASSSTASNFLGTVVNEWETAVSAIEAYSAAVIRLRIGLVLSTKGGVLQQLAFPVKLGAGAAFGTGQQGQSWIHIQDLVQLLLFSITQKESILFNAVAPNPVTQNEMIKTLGKVFKRPVFLPTIPAFLMQLILGERSALVLDSQFVNSEKVQKAGFTFKFLTLQEALENLYAKN